MFIGRERELETLERCYKLDSFQMMVVYGRRRVGKTRLIRQFLQGKNAVYFCGIESSAEKNLEQFSEALYRAAGATELGLPPFASFQAAFSYACAQAKKNKLILAIDEYPYLAAGEPGISSILQNFIDDEFSQTNMMLILCGSSMSFMERQVLGYKSPLYGRRTGQMLVMPLDYLDSARFVPSYSHADQAAVYGMTGGVPRYLELFDTGKSLRENVIDLFLRPDGYLFEEPSNLLKQELREPASYNAVIEAIARGASRMNEVATAVRKDTGAVAVTIRNLLSLGILRRNSPITEEKNTKKTYYSFADGMFQFWYQFVMPHFYLTQTDESEYLYDEFVAREMPRWMGHVFESMCQSWLTKRSKARKTPFVIANMGSWWGTDIKRHKQAEIDIVATDGHGDAALFGECKFRNELTGIEVLNALKEKAGCLYSFTSRYYALFSKSGFSAELRQRAESDSSLLLATLDDMYDEV